MKKSLYKSFLWVEFILRRIFCMRDFYIGSGKGTYSTEEKAIEAGFGQRFGDRMYFLPKEN